MKDQLEVLEKVLRYEVFEGGGYIPLFMKTTIEPIKSLIEDGHTLEDGFFEKFSLPTDPMEWYISESHTIKARPMVV